MQSDGGPRSTSPGIDPAVGKALKRSLRARQGEVDKLLAELTGEHEVRAAIPPFGNFNFLAT